MKRENKRKYIIEYAVDSIRQELKFYNEQIAKAFQTEVNGTLLEILN